LYINQKNEPTIDKPKGAVFNAISGDRTIMLDGQMVHGLAVNIPNPRTAVGITQNGRGLIFLVADGRQPGYSEGLNLHELVSVLKSFGAHHAINMDGGGSSTMVIRGIDGKPRILNSPIEGNAPGTERSVVNHLGVFIKA
jgi:exopolysaccharide biosynthesis protein